MRVIDKISLFFTISLLLTVPQGLLAQPRNTPSETDSFSLQRIFRDGKLSGNIRQFNMFTDNAPGLTDYFAVAAGASMRYETRPWKGLQMVMGGGFVKDIASSDFTRPDPVTGALDRYDAGLYELRELDNKGFLPRLEELHLQYRWKRNRLILGKQILKTPLANPQDGRMNPSMFDGLYGYFEPSGKIHLEGGWLWNAAPRSTSQWLGTAESMGIYPQGLTEQGLKSDYHGNIGSAGLFVVNLGYTTPVLGKMAFWDYYIENVLHTAFFQWEKSFGLTRAAGASALHAGLMAIRQDAVASGGNTDPSKTYVAPGSKSWVFSSYAAWSQEAVRFQLNTTRITADGRFLFPREWGRDPLFTFLPRERNEGLGDVWAFSGQLSWRPHNSPFSGQIGMGHYRLPDVKNYRLNKYGLPSYNQLNMDLKYRFGGRLEGLESQVLIAWKKNAGDLYNNERYRINKVDMINYNLVFNYRF